MSEKQSCNGHPVWREILTSAGDEAVAFYTKLLGWQTQTMDMGGGNKYTMFQLGEKSVAGVANRDEPAHWVTYFTVDDVDAAAKRGEAAGGKVLVPPTDIPGTGRFCWVQDPQGGISCPFKGSEEMPAPPADAQKPPGEFCWEEFMAKDAEAAVSFYRELYGWDYEQKKMGDGGTYHILKAGERGVAGVMQMPPEAAASPAHWIPYAMVEDVDAITKSAEGLGAKVYVAPRDIPDMGRFSVIADGVGATFAFYKNR